MLNNENIQLQKEKATAFLKKMVSIPEGYKFRSCLLFAHDQIPVFVFRYEKYNKENNKLGGEHFSVSIDLDVTKVMGVMHIDQQHCGNGLPDDQSAKKTALEYFPKIAPDLAEKFEVKWVRRLLEQPKQIPHESPFPFVDDRGNEHLVTGVRVKLYFEALDSWGWVIVGREGKVISFEREVNWNTTLNRRSTPAWLHDTYIKNLMDDIENIK